jgi:hypothetical protein
MTSSPKERGPALTVWLILLLVGNIGGTLIFLMLVFSSAGQSLFFPGITVWVVYLFAALEALNVVWICFLFLWKKWAFFGLCGSAVTALAVNLYIGVGIYAFWGLAGAVVTYLLLRPKWKLLDNF